MRGQLQYFNFARLNSDGAIDTILPPVTLWGGAVNTVAVQGPGTADKILVGGYNLRVGHEWPHLPIGPLELRRQPG